MIYTHRATPPCDTLNGVLGIAAGESGKGGAPTKYIVIAPESVRLRPSSANQVTLSFQDKPIQGPEDINGLSNEILLAIVADRLEGFQAGPYACEANADALDHVNQALSALHRRAADRVMRGVEGKLMK